MTTGALIFAYNNTAFDYVKMAAWTADNVRRHLGIPVALITDRPTDHVFDKVILQASTAKDQRWFDDAKCRVPWNNWSRPDAYDLSPWDRTLLIDADYVVASDRLKVMLDTAGEVFLCHDRAQDAASVNDFQGLNRMGTYEWPLCWATVLVYDRGSHARLIFDSMKMIRENWSHYQHIYHDSSRIYRNDHALTIALNIVNGHVRSHNHIPWPLVTVMPEHRLMQIGQDHYRLIFKKTNDREAWIEIRDQDFHAMGKQSLMDMIA